MHLSNHDYLSESRDRDSDEDWEEKEASRTISVKFTEDVPEAKEVRICCCPFYSRRPYGIRNSYKTFYSPSVSYVSGARAKFSKAGRWLRNNVYDKCSRQRAYLTMSSLIVTLE